ncbi:hypothetical protein Hypma_011319 [Hypsizygus marmoreus]|uniref:Uncharacterized protein n=1 Tax=Hypsizygus marmoreus TaxID=39966 RepID=A0A369JGC4_HYPMA|nr:hypothetical protein Hypma_011319 [Hypsizygus marmoreus]
MSNSLQDRWDRSIAAVVESAMKRPAHDVLDDEWDKWAALLAGPLIFFNNNRECLGAQGGRVGLGDDDVIPEALAVTEGWLQRRDRPVPPPTSPVREEEVLPPRPTTPPSPGPHSRSPSAIPVPPSPVAVHPPPGAAAHPKPQPVGHRPLAVMSVVPSTARVKLVIPPVWEEDEQQRSESPGVEEVAEALAERVAQPRKVKGTAAKGGKGAAKSGGGQRKGKGKEVAVKEEGGAKGKKALAIQRVVGRGEVRVQDAKGHDLGPYQPCDYCADRPELQCSGVVGETCHDCRRIHKMCSNNPVARCLRSAAPPVASSSWATGRPTVSVSHGSLKRRATSLPAYERAARCPRFAIEQGDARAALMEMQRLSMDMFRVLGLALSFTATMGATGSTGTREGGSGGEEEEGDELVDEDEMEVDGEDGPGA